MASKSRFMTGKQFSVHVSDAIRHHSGMRRQLENERRAAHDDRDAALEEINQLEDEDSTEMLEAKYANAIINIDGLAKRITWHNREIDRMSDKPDEPELDFMYEMPDDDTAKRKKASADQTRIGPAAKHGKAPPPETEPTTPADTGPEGVNEHLKAPIAELELPQKTAAAIAERIRHVRTIADLAAWIESHPEASLVRINLGCTLKEASELIKTVNAYRKQHRSAMAAAEKESDS